MIINSLLDTDLYKFTMMQVVLHQFPNTQVEYRFKCRNQGVDLRPYATEIQQAINQLCQLRFTQDELDYLASLPFIQSNFIDYLRYFQLNPDNVRIETNQELDIIIQGSWFHTILFEVPVLAIVNEIYCQHQMPEPDYPEARQRLKAKIDQIQALTQPELFKFSDFGSRRRFSKIWQQEMITTLAENVPNSLIGTSNVYFAKQLGLMPIGTMAHEFLQAAQSLGPRLVDSQKFALQTWANEYRGQLGIALSDVCGMDAFLRDFDAYFAKLYDGARQDSGDPIEWGDKLIQHYQQLGIDPKTKRMVFSDGLTIPKAIEIFHYFKDKAQVSFGIGTNLSNDFGIKALQIVIKMTQCQGQPVAKISDSPGKLMCHDQSYLNYLRQVFQL